MKICLFTDTHMIDRYSAYDDSVSRVIDFINSGEFDLALHLGDVVADGARHPRQFGHAVRQLAALDTPVRYIPGNHDVGDNPREAASEPSVNIERVAEFAALFGADHWVHEADGWQVVGLNALLFNSGTEAEVEQFAWLEDVLERGQGAVGLMLHKPLLPHEDHVAPQVRYVPEPARARLFDMLGKRDLKFVASGHVHQRRDFVVDGIHHIWVPSTSFCMPEALQPSVGDKVVGVTTLELMPDGEFRFEHVGIDGLVRHNALDHPEIYPTIAAWREKLGESGRLPD